MKNKILTLILTASMAIGLMACGSKTDEPEPAPVAEPETEASVDASEADTEEEPEVVELTADTIDKYYGFTYADVADNRMSSIEAELHNESSQWRDSTFSVEQVPAKFSEVTASAFEAETPSHAKESDPFVGGSVMDFIDMNMGGMIGYTGKTLGWIDGAPSVEGYDVQDNYFNAIDSDTVHDAWNYLAQNTDAPVFDFNDEGRTDACVMALFNKEVRKISGGSTVQVVAENTTDNWASILTCDLTQFSVSLSGLQENDSVTIGHLIVKDSKLSDIVAHSAPTSGTMDKGLVILTWTTESGTDVTVEFDPTTELPIGATITAASCHAAH